MKLSPPASSSDLERARAIAARLTEAAPGVRQGPVQKPEDYLHFGGPGAASAPPPSSVPVAVTREVPPVVRPGPAPVRPPASEIAPEPEPVVVAPPPPPRPEPVLRAAAPPRPPSAPPLSAPPRVEARPQPVVVPAAPAGEAIFEIEEAPEAAAAEEPLGVLEDADTPPPRAQTAAELEFEEELSGEATGGHEVEAGPPPELSRPWTEILDDSIYLAHARCALVMDGAGNIAEFRGDWPKNTLDKVGARLLKGIAQAEPPPTAESSQLVEIQLGSFWLTGLKVPLGGGRPVIVGFLSQAPIKREVRPGLEAEARRGHPI
jgi:hypothetical protein